MEFARRPCRGWRDHSQALVLEHWWVYLARVVELVRHGRLKSDCLYGVRVRVPPRVHPHVRPLLGSFSSTVWIPASFPAILPQSTATYALLRAQLKRCYG